MSECVNINLTNQEGVRGVDTKENVLGKILPSKIDFWINDK